MRFVFLTMDGNHGAALREAATQIWQEHRIDLGLALYDATTLRTAEDWQRLERDVAAADLVFGARLFGEDYVAPLERILAGADCPVCIITSTPGMIQCTRLGKFSIKDQDDKAEPGLLQQWARKLRPQGGSGEGRRQLAVLRNLTKVLKLVPGKARDLHSYIVSHQYWLNSSPENLKRMLLLFVERYVPGYQGKLPIEDPMLYPDVALVHPDAPEPFESMEAFTKWRSQQNGKGRRKNGDSAGTVGLLTLRTVALSGNTAHLSALIAALEAQGLDVRTAYASGLDLRPAIETFFTPGEHKVGRRKVQQSGVDVLVNGTGFSLVGGPAESRAEEASLALEKLDVDYMGLVPLAFQRVEEWKRDDSGLAPIHLVMNLAIPELDGASEPMVFGGPSEGSDRFVAEPHMVKLAARRIARRVALHRKANAEKKLALVVFNFPPNLGNAGTAAFLDVFASVYRLLVELKAAGYNVEVPASAEALRRQVTEGNQLLHGTDGNVAATMDVAEYRKLFPHYVDIEPFWGNAPGQLMNDGKRFFILGVQLGNIFVGVQPPFGYERDPMRLLMAKDAAPHHGFAAFYSWIDQVFGADAVLHFGTHGALEFMPGKQAGLSADCWPTRLLGGLPNLYYYCVNNPSEATIAKRRGAAVTISYLAPPLQNAGLYKGLRLLKESVDRYRNAPDPGMLEDLRSQADKLGVNVGEDGVELDDEAYVAALNHELIQIEQRMIPMGMHVLGQPPSREELADFLALAAAFTSAETNGRRTLREMVASGMGWDAGDLAQRVKTERSAQEAWERIDDTIKEAMRRFVTANVSEKRSERPWTAADQYLQEQAGIKLGSLDKFWAGLADMVDRTINDREIHYLLHALDGGFVPPSPANDLVRNPAVVPTGRNIHGLDPYRVPSQMALRNGAALVSDLLARLRAQQGDWPESVAVVLWGTDNLKSDGEGVAQVLAMMGARTRTDELGKVCDVELISLEELGRPRIDVVVTVSGVFRDLLFHQMKLLDKAARLAACADEPPEQNFVRRHALEQSAELGIPLEDAATRVFANAPGSYGGNINHLVESGTWDDSSQLSDAFLSRKSFAVNASGNWHEARPIMERALSTVQASFQNIDSFEVGISDIDFYYESLGGMTKSVETLSGKRPPVMVADAVAVNDRVGSLEQMVRLESRAKLLNPKWYEAMLAHGFEGAREIESRVNNTYGWSATTGAVDDWVYQSVAETYVLDEEMRARMSQLNPNAAAGVVRRLLEANGRGFWDADEATLESLREIYADLEDRLEGIEIG